mgnify:CR=1 FL=1
MQPFLMSKLSISREICNALEGNEMSWVDLACLTVMLWCAAKGYLGGLRGALLHFAMTLLALPAAFYFHKPLLTFLNNEWHFEAAFVAWYTRFGQTVPALGQATGRVPGLSAQAAQLAELFAPELAALSVSTQESLLLLCGTLLARIAAFAAFFLFFTVLARYFLSFADRTEGVKGVEWQRLGGMLMGLCHGFALSVVSWLLCDVALMLFPSGALVEDFRSSYMAAVSLLILDLFR